MIDCPCYRNSIRDIYLFFTIGCGPFVTVTVLSIFVPFHKCEKVSCTSHRNMELDIDYLHKYHNASLYIHNLHFILLYFIKKR